MSYDDEYGDYGFDDSDSEKDDYADSDDDKESERDDYPDYDGDDFPDYDGDDGAEMDDHADSDDDNESERDDYPDYDGDDGAEMDDHADSDNESERDDYPDYDGDDGAEMDDHADSDDDNESERDDNPDYDGDDGAEMDDHADSDNESERDEYPDYDGDDGAEMDDYADSDDDNESEMDNNPDSDDNESDSDCNYEDDLYDDYGSAERINKATLNNKQYSKQEKIEKIAALKPGNYKNVTVKHKPKIQKLFEMWENVKTLHSNDSEMLITEVQSNCVCFQDEFLIGRGCEGTKVYICLGSDGIERAIKRLPKDLCQTFLKNERDILTSPNAVDSPRIVNYWFYDEISSPDFGYLILNLYEQNLDEYINEKGKTMTEAQTQKMIRQILEGLKALHSREPRSLHRDLKPSNILVDVNGDLALSDFGIGKFFPKQGILYNVKWQIPVIAD